MSSSFTHPIIQNSTTCIASNQNNKAAAMIVVHPTISNVFLVFACVLLVIECVSHIRFTAAMNFQRQSYRNILKCPSSTRTSTHTHTHSHSLPGAGRLQLDAQLVDCAHLDRLRLHDVGGHHDGDQQHAQQPGQLQLERGHAQRRRRPRRRRRRRRHGHESRVSVIGFKRTYRASAGTDIPTCGKPFDLYVEPICLYSFDNC